MWISHDRLRSIAVGSGLCASLAGTTPIPAAMQEDALCTEVVESADGARHDKAALIYGLMLDDFPHAVASEHAHKLALRDLRTAVPDGRLPGGPGGTRRPVAVVICTKGRSADDSATRQAADHLIKRLGVSAIVTLNTPQALVTQRAIAESGASVLHVCERCGTEVRRTLEGIGDPLLVFQSFPPRASITPMILKKLPEFEAHVRERRGFDGSARIALPSSVRMTTVSGHRLQPVSMKRLRSRSGVQIPPQPFASENSPHVPSATHAGWSSPVARWAEDPQP